MFNEIKTIFSNLVSVDSPSLHERAMADHIRALFAALGVELTEDDSAARSGSETGNLYGFIPGDGEPLLLATHMDTVSPAIGKKAVFHEDGTVTSDGTTVLGADDLAGVTAVYEAVKTVLERGEHRPIELLFTTGEELYCKGAKAFDCTRLRSRYVLVPDLSGRVGTAAYAAPTILSFSAVVTGRSAHAGFAPEDGINAIRAVCKAVSALPQGRIDEGTTANIGVISGGTGVNIVPDKCEVHGEIRSLAHESAVRLAKQYHARFEQSAAAYGARLEWTQEVDIHAYETPAESRVIAEFERACRAVGTEPELIRTFGGSDLNVFAQHGLEGLVVANAMHNVHSCDEFTSLSEIEQITRILIQIL